MMPNTDGTPRCTRAVPEMYSCDMRRDMEEEEIRELQPRRHPPHPPPPPPPPPHALDIPAYQT